MQTRKLWPPPKARWLKTESMVEFRLAYANYRKGHWKGAKGELILCGKNNPTFNAFIQRPSLRNDSDADVHSSSIFQDVRDPKVIRYLQGLEQYRRSYRNFRLGEAKGAEGEFSKHAATFTSDQLRLLPVAALARCLADQVREKGAVKSPDSKFHVHYGVGKLGLGLVIPSIITSKKHFALMQRPSDAWQTLIQSKNQSVQLYINNCYVTRFYIIRSYRDLQLLGFLPKDKSLSDCHKLIIPPLQLEEPVDQSYGLLVFDMTLEPLIIKTAESFSCSLGAAVKTSLVHLATYLPIHSGLLRPGLYACENDHQAVDTLRDVLDNYLYIKECMVDRICSEREITANKIFVTSEPYQGEIVVTSRFPEAIKPAFGGPQVHLPSTSGVYSFLYNRKFLLVNGTHTTLAFMTLREFCQDPTEAPGDYTLLNADTLAIDKKQELKAWAAARCLILLHNHEVAVIKLAHNVENDNDVVKCLWEYAQTTMLRFSTVSDSTKRVLGGGVANRYETRLKAILDTLETFDTSVPLGYKMLKISGFTSMQQLKTILKKLVQDAECFVTLERPEAKNKESVFPRLIETYNKLLNYR